MFSLIFFFGISAQNAFASDQRKLTYAGRILKSDGTPVNASTQFKLQVTDTLGTCVMWEENLTSNVTNGVFDLQLGSGTLVFDGGGSGVIDKVFAQGKAVGCKASTPSVNLIPATSDDRNLAVSFNDGTGWQTLSSQIPIKAVPFAMSASGIAGFPVDLTGLADTYVLKYDLATKTWIPTANGAGAGVSSVTSGTGITVSGTAANPVVNLATPVTAANGGTGLNTSAAANGQLLIGTGSGLALNTLTAGSGISITNASGSITISAAGGGDALTTNPLSQFAATTSAQLSGVLSDETGSGPAVFSASPTLTGVPLAPTAAVNTNTTQLATTAFVLGQASSTAPLIDGTATVGTGTTFARADHVHPTDTTRAASGGWSPYSVMGVNSSGSQIAIPGTTSGTQLQWTVAGPAWTTAAYPASTTVNQLLYSSANNVIGGLSTANNGVLVTSNSGVPSFLANSATPGYVLTANAGAPPSWQALAGGGNAQTANPLSQFAATTSAQLAGVLSDETGTGLSVFNTSPTFATNITSPMIVGGSTTTSSLTYKTTSGAGTTGADHIFQVGNNGATEALRILNNGNVGIGLSSPAYKLDVAGDINITGNFKVNGTNISTGGMGGSGTTNYLPKFTAASTLGNSLIFENGTNVGIGTATPLFTLDVAQAAASTRVKSTTASNIVYNELATTLGSLFVAQEGTAGGFFAVGTSPNASVIANNIASPLQFGTSGNIRMTISSGGNVGIGTASPAVSLDVGSKTDAIALPKGANGTEPGSPVAGWIRFNTTTNALQFYNGTSWSTIVGGGSAVDPAGMISGFPMSCPTGWLEANGSAVSRTTYASLFSAIGVTYGPGDGSTTFNLPDYRGYFLRGWNHGAANDPDAASRTNRGDGTTGDNVGTKQADQFGSHTHNITYGASTAPTGGVGILSGAGINNYTGAANQAANGITSTGGNETRPKNVNVTYCISTATNSATTVASSGSGTTNYVPQWTSTTALGNSPIAVSGGNVGIGTASPAFGLDARSATFAAGPVCLAYATGSVSTGSSTWVKVPFNTTEFDPDSSFDTVNNRFRPTKAGYYSVQFMLTLSGTGSGAFTLYAAIYKNGSQYRQTAQLINYTSPFIQTLNVDTMMYFNGSTDYVEGWYTSNSATMATVTGNAQTTFGATFLRN